MTTQRGAGSGEGAGRLASSGPHAEQDRQPALFGAEAWASSKGAGTAIRLEPELTLAPEQLVEPYCFVLSDAARRWTVRLEAEGQVERGTPQRRLVARCSCGWAWAVARYGGGAAGLGSLFEHLRDHVLAAAAPVVRVEQTSGEWRRVRLAGGRVHCAADCWAVPRRGTGSVPNPLPCAEHGGSLRSRLHHWETSDPAASGQVVEGSLLEGPDGRLWHFWCAPLEGRRLFGFVREEEESEPPEPTALS
ncbi:MAG: hypothetical protein F4056_10580 [Chloroflexi bacterium]|nr:hypothetical protein [Chloroflexota bacterium]